MATDRERKLLKSIGIDEETMSGDDGISEEERKFEEIIEKAFLKHKIPVECIEYIPVSPDMAAKVVIYKEC